MFQPIEAAQQDQLLTPANTGVPASTLARLERQGDLWRLAHGVYIGDGHTVDDLSTAAAWHLRHPRTVVGGLTMAAHFWLCDAFPRGTWLLYPTGLSRPRCNNPTLRLHALGAKPELLDPDDPINDLHPMTRHGHTFLTTGRHRTTLDLVRYRHRISYENAWHAIQRLTGHESYDPDLLRALASRLRCERALQKFLDRS